MNWLAVTLFCIVAVVATGANDESLAGKLIEPNVRLIGRIQHPRITESSGVVVSRKDASVFWTHNDGGGRRQVLYAMTREGKPLAEFRVTGALLEDWEDIAADEKGHLFLADTGNNDAKPRAVAVHQVDEPDLHASQNGITRVTRSWNLRYPDGPFDCESLVIWGSSGYLMSKVSGKERAGLYRFSLTNGAPFQMMTNLGEIKIDSPVTGADITHDGKLLGIVAKDGAYVFRIHGDMTHALKGKPYQNKFKPDQIEGCTFVPEGLLTTAESREIYLFTDEAFRTGPAKKK